MLAFSTSFTAFYNVFYESKDLASYRPYAFKESEIIIAKGLSVLLPALAGIVPILAYFLVLYIGVVSFSMAGFAFDAAVLGLIICLCYFSDGSGSTFLGSD